jgi:hypothetical protein
MQPITVVDVKTLLEALVNGTLGGSLAYWIIVELVKSWAWFAAVCELPGRKRVVGFVVAGLLAVLAWLAGIALGIWAAPAPGVNSWLIAIANTIITAGSVAAVAANTWQIRDINKTYYMAKEQADVKARLAAQEKQRNQRR